MGTRLVSVTAARSMENPAPAPPPVRVPTEVREEFRTVELSVAPESVPAGATTTFPPAVVMRPFALTVRAGIDVEEPNVPTLEFTVASVPVTDPDPEAARSPVMAVIPPPPPPPGGAAHVPSARRKFAVPPPEGGTQPIAPAVNTVQGTGTGPG